MHSRQQLTDESTIDSRHLPAAVVTRETSRTIRGATKVDDGWDLVKTGGIGAVRQGDAAGATARLLAGFRDLRLFLVDVGEVERFHTAVPHESSQWLAEVLAQGLHTQAGPHRDFVRAVADSFDG